MPTKCATIVPVGRSLRAETQIRLVDERCRLQRMTAPFLAQIVMRQSAQLGVDEGEKESSTSRPGTGAVCYQLSVSA